MGLSDEHWQAIDDHQGRLDRAVERDDLSGVIGAAKELCECIARVICAVQAQTVSNTDDFGQVISTAHEALDRRPGRGSAVEAHVRQIAETAKKMTVRLGQLRNELGTGHGRSLIPVVTRETAAMAEQSGRLWATWALARLDEVLRGEVPRLVQELEGGWWHRGLLKQRFTEVGLSSLHSEDQHRLGVAVAHRSSGGGTFVVTEAGVSPLKESAGSWPNAFRTGVAGGLLIDSRGQFALQRQFVEVLSVIVAAMDIEDWQPLSRRAIDAPLDGKLGLDTTLRQALSQDLSLLDETLDLSRRTYWIALQEKLLEVDEDNE